MSAAEVPAPVTAKAVAGVGKALYRTGDRAAAERALLALADRADGALADDLRAAAILAGSPVNGSRVRKCVGAIVRRYWPEVARP